jgi:eukaryotic-like serine/threonine-protein kinase
MTQRSDQLQGKLIANRYLVTGVLGAGGLCVVYRGEDLRHERDVAIKVLPPEKARIGEFASRFQREVTTAKRLDHPNIAAISDSGTVDDGGLFLIMELLKGTLLSNVLEKGPLPAARALVIARQILVALGEAHRIGVIHRDVKPSNVMLVDVNGLETVKLFDFGIAANERAAVKLTAAGTAFGTPEYISPEMAMGQKVDPRADLYGVGVVLFEMVTGRLPFVRADGIEYLRAHINEQPPRASEVAPARVTARLDGLLARALEKSPDKRFSSTDAMIAAVDRVGGHRPLEARGPTWKVFAFATAAVAAAAAASWWWLAVHAR